MKEFDYRHSAEALPDLGRFGAAGGVRWSGRDAGRMALAAFLAAGLILAASAYLLQHFVDAQAEREYREAGERAAARFAKQLEQTMRSAAVEIERLAQDPDLPALLDTRPVTRLRAKEDDLRGRLSGVLRAQLLRAGATDADLHGEFPIGYACTDMLRRAEASGTPPPAEIHLFGRAERHIDIVRPVPGPIPGYLLVTLDGALLLRDLAASGAGPGYLELRQGRDGINPIVLALHGEHGYRAGAPEILIAIPGTAWELAYWSAPFGGSFSPEQRIAYWGMFAAALAALGVVLLVLWRMARRMPDGMDGWVDSAQVRALRSMPHGQAAAHPALGYELGNEPAYHPVLSFGGEESAVHPIPPINELDPIRPDPEKGATPDPSIFRSYDIRGIAATALTPEAVYEIGRAIGSEAYARGQQAVAVGRDGRLSSPELAKALIWGLQAAGRDVIDIGLVPTPVLYFATHYLGANSGVMVTGSHNPPEYNGLKIVLQGEALSGDGIQAIRRRLESGALHRGEGDLRALDISQDYLTRITSDVRLSRPLKVVVDCGNGAAGELAPQLFRALGCDVTELYCEIDGCFPNHHPDPSQTENLEDLIRAVQERQADVGLAFDGDGDRVGLVTSDGTVIWPDRLLMLLAMDVLTRNPAAEIIYDVKCSRGVERVVREHGGRPLMWKTGHSLIKAKMRETGALLAGEMSGHLFFLERWYGFDDGLYAAARLLEILAADPRSSAEVFAALPDSINTPELRVTMAEGEPFRFMERFKSEARFNSAAVTGIDGLRVDFEEGWGLVRASHTTPSLILRFEAEDAETLHNIQARFREQMLAIDPHLQLPF